MAKITAVSDDEAPPSKIKTTSKTTTPPSSSTTTTPPKVTTTPPKVTTTPKQSPPINTTTTTTTNTASNINIIDNDYLSDEELLEELEEPEKLFCSYHDCPKTEHDSEDFESDSQSSESDTEEARLKSSKLLVRKKKVNEKNGNNIYQSDYFIRQLANGIPSAFNEFGRNYSGTLVDSEDEANSSTSSKAAVTTNKKNIEFHFYSSKPLSLEFEPSRPEDKLFPKHFKTDNNNRNVGAKKSKDLVTNTTTTTASVINKKKDKTKNKWGQDEAEEEEGYGNFYNDYIDSFDKFDEYDEHSEDESFVSHPHLYRKRELIPAFKRTLTAKFKKTTKKPVKPPVDIGKFVDDPNDCFHPMYREVDQGFHLCDNRSLLITKLLKSKVSQSSIFKKVKNPLLVTKDHSICERLNCSIGNTSTPKQKRKYCWQNVCNSDTEDEKRLQESSSKQSNGTTTTTTTSKTSSDDDDDDDDEEDEDEDNREEGNYGMEEVEADLDDMEEHPEIDDLEEIHDQVDEEEEEHYSIDSDVDDYPTKKPTAAPPTQLSDDEEDDENAPPVKRKGGVGAKTGDVDAENEGPKNCKNQ